MAIKWANDLGAPLTVTAIDLIVESTAPDWNEWAAYIAAAGGYLGAFMGWGGDFLKNVGIASFPWAAKKIYQRARGVTSSPARLAMKKVSRWPAPLVEEPFGGARLV